MGNYKEPQNRITNDVGKPIGPSPALELPAKFRTSADYRNDEIENALKTLERLETRFREGDPVREVLIIARRTAAKHFVVSPSSGDGLRVIK